MRLRTRAGVAGLQNYQLDSLDMFLVSRLDSALTPAELTDISPCSRDETARRVRALIALGLIEVVGSEAPPRASTPPTAPASQPQQSITIPPSAGFAQALLESGRSGETNAQTADGRTTEKLTRNKPRE
ncbi:MAG: hypothetical protein QM778_29325 [Myxococcales bacterium]